LKLPAAFLQSQISNLKSQIREAWWA